MDVTGETIMPNYLVKYQASLHEPKVPVIGIIDNKVIFTGLSLIGGAAVYFAAYMLKRSPK